MRYKLLFILTFSCSCFFCWGQEWYLEIATSSYYTKEIDSSFYVNRLFIPSVSVGVSSDSVLHFGSTTASITYSKSAFELRSEFSSALDTLVEFKSVTYVDYVQNQNFNLISGKTKLALSTSFMVGLLAGSRNNKSTLLKNEPFDSQFREFTWGLRIGILVRKDFERLKVLLSPRISFRPDSFDLTNDSIQLNGELGIGFVFR